MDTACSIIVSNISPEANEKTVSDFFSFCGRITDLDLHAVPNDKDGVKEAVVTFESPGAAKTSLLLSNAMIIDRPLNVRPYTGDSTPAVDEAGFSAVPLVPPPAAAPMPATHERRVGDHVPPPSAESVTRPDETVAHPSKKSGTAVVSALIAAGYILAEDTVSKARAFDAGLLNVSGKLSTAGGVVGNVFYAAGSVVAAGASGFDSRLGVTSAASKAANVVQERLGALDNTVGLTSSVNAGIGAVASTRVGQTTASAYKSVTDGAYTLATGTKEEIERRRKKREAETDSSAMDSIEGPPDYSQFAEAEEVDTSPAPPYTSDFPPSEHPPPAAETTGTASAPAAQTQTPAPAAQTQTPNAGSPVAPAYVPPSSQ